MAVQIEELLNCAVCLERYNRPKILPCQHTFCQSPCLENLIDIRVRKLKCPECRMEHRVPGNGVRGFPNNVTISRFLDIPAEALSSTINGGRNMQGGGNFHQCGTCQIGLQDGTTSQCTHCKRNFCENCKPGHANEVKLDIGRFINQLRRNTPKLSDGLTMVEQRRSRLGQHCETVKAEIQGQVERIVKELRNREQMLLSEVEMFLLSESRSLNIQKESLEVDLVSISSHCDATERHLNNAPEDIGLHELSTLFLQSMDYIQKLRNLEVNPAVNQDKKVKFSETNRHELFSSVMSYGEVSVSDQSNQSNSRPNSRGLGLSRHTPPLPSSSDYISLQINHANNAMYGNHRGIDLESSHTSPLGRRSSANDVRNPSLMFRDMEDLGGSINIPQVSRSAGGIGRGRNRRRQWDRPIMGTGASNDLVRISEANDNQLDFRNPAGNSTIGERTRNRTRDFHGEGHISLIPAANHGVRSNSGRLEDSPVGSTEGHISLIPTSTSNSRSPVVNGTGNDHSTERPRTRTMMQEHALTVSTEFRNPAGNLTIGPRPRPRRFDIRLDDNSDEFIIVEDNDSAAVTTGRRENTNEPRPFVNYNQKGRSRLRFGKKGTTDACFSWPRGVATLPDNQIVVADSSNHRVQVFDEFGQFLCCFGTHGTGDGQFDCLAGVCTNSRVQIIIADRYNHRIQVIEPSGRFVCKFGQEGSEDGKLNYPWGVACDRADNIYVCDRDNHRIQVFTVSGTFIRKFGRLGHSAGQLESPHYVAIHDDKVFVSDSGNHCVQVFNLDGQFQWKFGQEGSNYGQFKYPRGIVTDPHGYVLVGDSGNNRIQVFRPSGTYMACFGTFGAGNGQLKGVEGVAMMSNGNIVVSDRENHRIHVF
ncbi:RING finger protein nhl-1-like [Saccoglossus kowalevskii]|uniref:RING finger protein nhl-1-like n=1 Tax=Saccoglossus kowalevskii TaxID=10224 RepID=A0ABM0GSF2_SACKO|nr:PREDICTED: RING finger protein nhl-1-like [Saccoglossus kowalevskii]